MSLAIKTQSNPSAGADFTMTVPAGKYWRLKSFHAKLVTSVTAVTRVPKFIVDDGTNTLWAMSDPGQSASITADWNLLTGGVLPANPAASAVGRLLPLPGDLVLPPGSRIRSSTASIDAADQWSEINATVEEYSSDPTVQGGRHAT